MIWPGEKEEEEEERGTQLNSQDVQELADEALTTLSRHLWFQAPNTALSCSPSPVRSWRMMTRPG